MFRLAICVKSCQRDKLTGCHQAIRDTWGKDLPAGVDLLFFMGGDKPPADLLPDERFLPVDDGYWTSTPKMLAIVKYAVWKDYDFSLLCDTDTYLDIPGLMASGFDQYDYSGLLSGGRAMQGKPAWIFGQAYKGKNSDHSGFLIEPSYAYMSGGHGYILSKRAAKVVATLKTKIEEGEDIMVGWVLGPFFNGEFTAKDLPNFKEIAFHLGCGYYGGNRRGERLDPAAAVRKKHEEMTQ